jgi:hypothetical protein
MCCAIWRSTTYFFSRSSTFVVNDFKEGYNQRMTDGPNRQVTYGPLALERHVKDDGRKLLVYTLRHGTQAQTGGARTQTGGAQTQTGGASTSS